MTTAIKSKGLPEILEEREAKAATGSCKTCQYLVPSSWEEHPFMCGVQGNVNPIHFGKAGLDSAPYPYGPCDDGNWSEIGDDGTRTPIPGCQAYDPKTIEGTEYGDATVRKHWWYMETLAKAAKLHYAIEEAQSGVSQAKLTQYLEHLNTGNFEG